MEIIKTCVEMCTYAVNFILHLDVHLVEIFQQYGTLTYAILFLIVFCETGLVVTPFLPGDSLLFAAGALAAGSALDIKILLVALFIAPLLGDQVNYWLGRLVGSKLPFSEDARILKKQYLDKTHSYYEKFGGKTVIIARFVPIVRTFAPFVAGIGRMHYLKFISFSIAGALLWVGSFLLGGYYFGNIPFIKKNFTITIMVIILISLLPGLIEYMRHRRSKS
ncbi:MAG: DedA family protein [Desulfocapsaceae bacterium]|nr:DedA family protein [Desulfocapsaceae bacterium]